MTDCTLDVKRFIAAVLHDRLGADAAGVARREAPKAISNTKAITQLGWQPRSGADTVTATAESLLQLSSAAGR